MESANTSSDEELAAPGHAVETGTGERPHPGDIVIDRDLGIAPEPLVGADASTALAENEDDTTIPLGPLWVMKARRHTQWHLLASSERHERLRETLGTGDDEIHAIDDGRHHVMIARVGGSTGDDVEYSLVGRLTRASFEELRGGEVPISAAFEAATELVLCGAAVEEGVESSNIFDVARFGSADEVPNEYLPGTQSHHFAQPLEITSY